MFSLLIGVFSIFIISTLLLGDPKAGKKIDETSQLMITMVWGDNSADDMDLWIQDPQHQQIGFNHRQNSFISLDHDDLGNGENYIMVNGVKQEIHHNEEITRIQKMEPGHYVVNVMFYSRKEDPQTHIMSSGPQPVTVTLLQVNPAYSVLFKRTFTIANQYQQETAFSFDITPDGQVDDFTTEEVPFLKFGQNSNGQDP